MANTNRFTITGSTWSVTADGVTVGAGGGQEWPKTANWEDLSVLKTLVSGSDTIDLEGRMFALSASDDITLSSSYLSINTGETKTITNGRISAGRQLTWADQGAGRWETVGYVLEPSSHFDPQARLIDPLADAFPTLATWPAAPDEIQEYRRSPSTTHWKLVCRANDPGNGTVHTDTGDYNGDSGDPGFGGIITGFTITNTTLRNEITAAIGARTVTDLSLIGEAGPAFTYTFNITSWNDVTGEMVLDNPDNAKCYSTGMGFVMLGNPDFMTRPGDYTIDKTNNKIIYDPVNNDATGAIISSAVFCIRNSGGTLNLNNVELTGTIDYAGAALLTESVGTNAETNVLNSYLHSAMQLTALQGSGAFTYNRLNACDRAYGGASGAAVENCHIGPIVERSSAISILHTDDSSTVPTSTVRGNYIELPMAYHGNGVSLYYNAWMNSLVEHNLFRNCDRVLAFQPGGELSEEPGTMVFQNNLCVRDITYRPLLVGQVGLVYNGANDDFLFAEIGNQVVDIKCNSCYIDPSLYPDPITNQSMQYNFFKLRNCNVSVENCIGADFTAAQENYGGAGPALSHHYANNGAWGYTHNQYASFGAFDMAAIVDDTELQAQLDFANLRPTPGGAYATGASDGGPIGHRWNSTPTVADLDNLDINWASIYTAAAVPTATQYSDVYEGDDLRT